MFKERSSAAYKIEEILDLCEEAAFLGNEVLDRDKARNVVLDCIDKGFCKVIERDGELKGVLLGFKMEHSYLLTNPNAHELVWYVRPEERGRLGAARLLRDFISWAKENECDRVIMSSFTGKFLEVSDRMLTKAGFYAKEVIYEREF